MISTNLCSVLKSRTFLSCGCFALLNLLLPFEQVIPSHGEGWGRPHMEAMACGTPVVFTNWSGPVAFIDCTVGYPISILPDLVPAE